MLSNPILKTKKGSLLLEALLATAILSVSIVLVIQSLASSARATAYNVNYSKALLLLEDKLFDSLRNPQGKLAALDEGTFEDDKDFNYRLAVGGLKQGSVKGLDEIEASVFWNPDGKKQQLQLVTYRFRSAAQ